MSDIKLVDVTVHIDKDTDTSKRGKIETALREINGVISVHMPEKEGHLVVIEYNPDKTQSSVLLDIVQKIAGHAELIGL
ncbi:MAG: ATP-binding protein [Pseudomonadota bacterium]